MSLSFKRFRSSVFGLIAGIELLVSLLLCLLGFNLPHKSQIAATFDQARGAGCVVQGTLERLRGIPLAGRLVEPEWIDGVHNAQESLDLYEQQMVLTVSTTAWITWLVAVIVVLHAVYLLLALRYGQVYSP